MWALIQLILGVKGDFLPECLIHVDKWLKWGHSGHILSRAMGEPGWLIACVISPNPIFLSLKRGENIGFLAATFSFSLLGGMILGVLSAELLF